MVSTQCQLVGSEGDRAIVVPIFDENGEIVDSIRLCEQSAATCETMRQHYDCALAKVPNVGYIGTFWQDDKGFRSHLSDCLKLAGIPNPGKLRISQIQELLFGGKGKMGMVWELHFVYPKFRAPLPVRTLRSFPSSLKLSLRQLWDWGTQAYTSVTRYLES